MLEIKNIITEITNVFDRLTNRVNTAEEGTSQLRISQLKPSEQESKQTNKKDKKNKVQSNRLCDIYKNATYV